MGNRFIALRRCNIGCFAAILALLTGSLSACGQKSPETSQNGSQPAESGPNEANQTDEADDFPTSQRRQSIMAANLVSRVDLYQVPEPARADLLRLKSEIESCGLSSAGPVCLDSTFTAQKSLFDKQLVSAPAESGSKPKWLNVTAISSAPSGNLFYLVSQRTEVSHLLYSWKNAVLLYGGQKAEVVTSTAQKLKKATKEIESITHVEDLLGLNRIGAIEFKPFSKNDLIEQLRNEKSDFRSIYHTIDRAVRDQGALPAAIAGIAAVLKVKVQMIVDNSNSIYLTAFIRQARARLANSSEYVVQLSRLMIEKDSYTDRSGKQLAAISLMERIPFEENPNSIRALVITSLKSTDQPMRIGAMKLISKYAPRLAAQSIVLEAASDTAWEVRQEAAKALGKHTTPEASSGLIKLLSDADTDVSRSAQEEMEKKSIGEHEVQEMGKYLTNAATSKNAKVQMVHFLNKATSEQARNVLLSAVSDSSWEVRQKVVYALSKYDDSQSKAALIQLLTDSDADVRRTAKDQLEKKTISTNEIKEMAALLPKESIGKDSKLQIIEFLSKSKSSASRNAILKATTDSNWEVRNAAIRALSQYDSPESNAAFIKLLTDSDVDVRRSAKEQLDKKTLTANELRLLGKIFTNSSAPKDSKLDAVHFLSKSTDSIAVTEILNGVGSTDWEVRNAIAKVLGKHDSAVATAALIKFLVDSDTDVRASASAELAKKSIGSSEAQLLGGYLGQAGIPAESKIMIIRFLSTSSAPEARLALLSAVSSSEWQTRQAVANALGKYEDSEVTSALLKLAMDTDSDVRNAARDKIAGRKINDQTLLSFEKCLSDSSSEVRESCAKMLGDSGNKNAIPLLQKRLEAETDDSVIRAIQSGIKKLRAN